MKCRCQPDSLYAKISWTLGAELTNRFNLPPNPGHSARTLPLVSSVSGFFYPMGRHVMTSRDKLMLA